MIARNNKAGLPVDYLIPVGLPFGSEIQEIAFVSERNADQAVVLELPHPFRRQAVLVSRDANQKLPASTGSLQILTIPLVNDQESELQERAREWVEAGARKTNPNSQFFTLQGAQIFWTPGRLAVIAQADRMDTVRLALVEVSWYEAELRDIEQTVGEAWPQLESDMPLAFEIDDRSIRQRRQLMKRFQQVLLIQARLARLAPHVDCPHQHPPTLASQVAERFRERTRMVHRCEFLDEQVEVFEKIYDSCGQRASDFMLNRSSNMLEWIIIVLLSTQILLTGFEILTSLGQ